MDLAQYPFCVLVLVVYTLFYGVRYCDLGSGCPSLAESSVTAISQMVFLWTGERSSLVLQNEHIYINREKMYLKKFILSSDVGFQCGGKRGGQHQQQPK